jgi:hypothetical protein
VAPQIVADNENTGASAMKPKQHLHSENKIELAKGKNMTAEKGTIPDANCEVPLRLT